MARIVLLTNEDNPIAGECDRLLQERGHDVTVLATRRRPISAALAVRAVLNGKRRRELRRLAYDRFFWWAQRTLRIPFERPPGPERVQYVEDMNAKSTSALITSLHPDVGIVIGTPPLTAPVFSIPRRGMINLHQGHIPFYRGIPPAYWEHRRGESRMFVTVHTVVAQLDLGGVLEERRLEIAPDRHFVQSKLRANAISAELLVAGVTRALAGEPGEARAAAGPPNTVPTLVRLGIEAIRVLAAAPAARRRFRARGAAPKMSA